MQLSSVARGLLKASLSTWWGAAVLLTIAVVVYGPAMNRVFADDQINYLAELNGRTSLADGLHHVDYAVTRRFWKGDDALFRPLVFTWLALGNTLFSYHHVGWNVATLLLHVLVAIALFRLLITIRPSPFALPGAVLFLVLKPPIELVLWNHLGGYLLAAGCFAAGARTFVRLTRSNGAHALRDAAAYAAAFAAAALCYETMAIVSLLGAAIAFALERRRTGTIAIRPAAVLLVPAALFVSLYAVHATRVERLTYVDRPDAHDALEAGDLVRSLSAEGTVVTRWIAEFALPSAVELSARPFSRFETSFGVSWTDPRLQVNALVAVAALFVAGLSSSLAQWKRNLPLLLFLVGSMVLYICVIGLGRSSAEILGITYYTYLFGLVAAVVIYAIVDFDRMLPRPLLVGLAGATLLATIGVHAGETVAAVRGVERNNHYQSLYLQRLINFVDQHRSEPDFTFAILPNPESLDPEIYLVEGYPHDPDARSQRRRLSEILFARYYNGRNPKYLLDASAVGLAGSRR